MSKKKSLGAYRAVDYELGQVLSGTFRFYEVFKNTGRSETAVANAWRTERVSWTPKERTWGPRTRMWRERINFLLPFLLSKRGRDQRGPVIRTSLATYECKCGMPDGISRNQGPDRSWFVN